MIRRFAIGALLAGLVSIAQAESGSYHFTTPQTQQGLQEATTVVRTVAMGDSGVGRYSDRDALTFSGSEESVALAEWILPQIDKASGDGALHEYRVPSGDVARVVFVPNAVKPQQMQELLTILRTVADVQKIFSISANHALVFRGPEWQVLYAQWIIDQLNVPAGQKQDTTPREFTVGGPDYRGMGHGARVNFLANLTKPQQMQELLTVLRTVGDVQKVFSCTSGHAFVLRSGGCRSAARGMADSATGSAGRTSCGSTNVHGIDRRRCDTGFQRRA